MGVSREQERRLRRAVSQAKAAEARYVEARQRLREEIRFARETGMTLDAIAAIVGVSRQRIIQLLR